MVYGRSHGKCVTPSHSQFMKNKLMGHFATKHLDHAGKGAGGGGKTHYPEPKAAVNTGVAGEKFNPNGQMHHK